MLYSSRKVILSMLLLASGLIAADPARPVKIARYRNVNNRMHAFALDRDATGIKEAFTRESIPLGLASSPEFHLFTEAYAGTKPIHAFRTPDGSLRLAANEGERLGLRINGFEELAGPFYVYADPVEGTSEIFRLYNPQNGDLVYTTSMEERDYYLGQAWRQDSSLGFTQATSSSGTGILRPTTVKFDSTDASLLAQPVGNDGKLIFSSFNPKFANLAPGTVLYSEKTPLLPIGLVAKVASISTADAGGLEIATTPASLADAFLEFHIFIENQPFYFDRQEDDDTAALDSPARRGLPILFEPEGGAVLPDYLAEARLSGRMVMAGAASKAIWSKTFVFDTMLERENSPAVGSLELKGGIVVSMTGEANLSYSAFNMSGKILLSPVVTGNMQLITQGTIGSKKSGIPILKFPTITSAVGGIPVTLDVGLYGGFGVTGTLTASAEVTVRGTAGFDFSLGAPTSASGIVCPKTCPGGFSCGPGYTGGPTCSITAKGTAEPSASAFAYIEPKIGLGPGLSFAGVGAKAEVTEGLKIQVEGTLESPNLNVYFKLIPDVGADLTFGPFSWSPLNLDVGELKWLMWQIGRPVATTGSPTSVTSTSAAVGGNLNPNGAGTSYWFAYATNPSLTGALLTPAKFLLIGRSTADVSASFTGLTPGTTYYYQVRAVNILGSSFGSIQSFSTQKAPSVVTGGAGSLSSTTAVLNGNVNPNSASTQYWFVYASNPALSGSKSSAVYSLGPATNSIPVGIAIAGLSAGSTYYYQLKASNSLGTSTGSTLSFTTLPAVKPPSVTTGPATSTSSGASVSSTVNPNGAATQSWFLVSTNSQMAGATKYGLPSLPAGTTAVTRSYAVTGLKSKTTYYYQAQASNSAGTGSGSVLRFTTR